jgi:uncharacterized protein YjbJ (UPF0337 family)
VIAMAYNPGSDPSKTSGQLHSVKGTLVESVSSPYRCWPSRVAHAPLVCFQIGNMTGAQSWQQSGAQEHASGEAEYDAARAKGYAEGTMDRAVGKKDSIVGAITGDRSQEVAVCRFSRGSPYMCGH